MLRMNKCSKKLKKITNKILKNWVTIKSIKNFAINFFSRRLSRILLVISSVEDCHEFSSNFFSRRLSRILLVISSVEDCHEFC